MNTENIATPPAVEVLQAALAQVQRQLVDSRKSTATEEARAERFRTERDEANRRLDEVYNLTEGDADGAPDSTPLEKLCNTIVGIVRP